LIAQPVMMLFPLQRFNAFNVLAIQRARRHVAVARKPITGQIIALGSVCS